MHTHRPLPNTEAELDTFLSAFEDGTYPKSDWTHAAHLVAGSSYLYTLGHNTALDYMRDRVRHYNLATGGQNTATGGYQEARAAWLPPDRNPTITDLLFSTSS